MVKPQFMLASIMLLILTAQVSADLKIDIGNEITFQNSTGETIRYVYVTPSDSQHWSTDILGSDRVLRDGDSLSFYIHYPGICERFDIVAIGEFDNAFTSMNQLICDGAEALIALSDDSLSEDEPDLDLVEIVFDNRTTHNINYLFFSPGDSATMGVDQLDAGTWLRPDLSVGLYIPAGYNPVRYNVLAIDENANAYSFHVDVDNQDERSRITIDLASMRQTRPVDSETGPARSTVR